MTTTLTPSRSTLSRTLWANSPGDISAGADTRARPFIEREDPDLLATPRGGHSIGQRDRRFAHSGASDQQQARPALDAAAEQRVELGRTGRGKLAEERLMVLRSDEARVDGESARLDREVVVSAPELHAPHFDDAQAPALRAVIQRELLQRYDAVRNAV